MPELNVTRRAVLYGTAASLTGAAGPHGAEAQPAIASRPPPPSAGTVDFVITVNGEPLLVTAEPTLLGRLEHFLGLADLPAPLPLVAHCDQMEAATSRTLQGELPPPGNRIGH